MHADMIAQLLKQTPGNSNQTLPTLSMEKPSIKLLVASVREVLLQAKSSIAESEGGSDSSSVVTMILHRLEILEEDIRGNDLTPGNPTTLYPLSDQHRIIEDWIPSVSPESTTSHLYSRSATTRTQMTPTQSTPSVSTVEGQTIFTQEDSDDDDEEFESEILRAYLDKGFASYENGNWEIAEPFLRRAMDTSKILPLNKIPIQEFQLAEARFKIAVCAFH